MAAGAVKVTLLSGISKSFYIQRLCSTIQRVCWKCGNPVKNMFCSVCTVLQSPDKNKNFFDLLQITRSFEVDVSQLASQYRKLQAVLHPDKFSNKSKASGINFKEVKIVTEEMAISEDYSSLVNKAYSILLDPMKRGLYMLNLYGQEVAEGSTSLDKSFLMNIMELNENLESISGSIEMQKFSSKIDVVINSLIVSISDAFRKNDVNQAKILLMKMKYYVSIKKKLKQKKQVLNIPD